MAKKKKKESLNKPTKSQKRRRKKRTQDGFRAPRLIKGLSWDKQKTLKQNYSQLGLTADLKRVSNKKMAQVHTGFLTDELTAIQQLPSKPPCPPKRIIWKERLMLERLIAKYGDDVNKMARDYTINVQQKTATQLAKRLALYREVFVKGGDEEDQEEDDEMKGKE